MDTLSAFIMGEANRGNPMMVFDWVKAAQLIVEAKPKKASAGLRGDWEWTGGVIFQDGKIVEDSYTYLASTWAVPELDMDGTVVPCYVTEPDNHGWNEKTKWPPEARDIIARGSLPSPY